MSTLTTVRTMRIVPPMSKETELARVALLLPPKLLRRVEKYWHGNTIRNRNEAIRDLLEFALDEKGIKEDDGLVQ